jgi:circadian clock protein KaiC
LDEILGGGLPRGRPTLVCGDAGCGKTLLAMEFIVRGATQFGEPGLFVSFEETERELVENVASLGFDLADLVARRKLLVDYIHVAREEILETGEYDLEGLFIRLNAAIDEIGARRVALDTIESLFSGLPNPSILRAELRRLFRWLKDKGVTVVITGERGEGTFTRQGLEEYVSDCVILLDHRVTEQVSTRRLRVVKYRGSTHGTHEFPFLIDERGISVLPVTSLGLRHIAGSERVSSGIPRLDAMLGGQGYYRGSTVLISGTAGSGKSGVAAAFVDAACRRGERALYAAFEESPSQIIRNMRSIGIDLEPWLRNGLLQFHAVRPTAYGLETHLAVLIRFIRDFQPDIFVMDPLNSHTTASDQADVKTMLIRLVDFLKGNGTTALFTSLTAGGSALEHTDVAISSLIDTWLLLRDIESGGERNRGLYILKSRGMAHSNQISEFLITNHGIQLVDAYLGPQGVLTGSARLAQEAQEQAAQTARRQEVERLQRDLERKRQAMELEIAALRAGFEAEKSEFDLRISQEQARESALRQDEIDMARSRRADPR